MIKVVAFVSLCIFSIYAHASDKFYDIDILNDCSVTPQVWVLDPPAVFAKTSDLSKAMGSTTIAKGEAIVVTGRVLDQRCVPITGVTVKIWQKNLGPENQNSSPAKQDFYTGITHTDNLGNFSFNTIMPAAKNLKNPTIHFALSHRDITDFETQMFFLEDKKKNSDASLWPLFAKCINCHNFGKQLQKKVYNFNIILENKNRYKRY